jgi:alkanesulfonate monooxygenase SsuD/methylene tetrahydromethanopterin reductase-like flavin-dependent oxidoreductase (luciferase family)
MAVMDQLSVVAFPWGKHRPTVDELVEAAQEAERLGFYSVNVPMINHGLREDVLFASFGHDHIVDALIVMAAMLRGTSRIRVASDALPPILPPYYFAKNLATLDDMSGGRVVAGFCPGIGEEQFGNHGVPFAKRGSRCAELVEIVSRLWTEDRVSHEGEYYRLQDATLEPKPAQKPRPPIWWAGREISIPRAVRLGDTFVYFRPSPEQIRTSLAPLLAAENEKQGKNASLACWVYVWVTPDRTLSPEEIDERFGGYYFATPPAPREAAAAGSPEQCAAKLREYFDAGASRIVLDFANHGVDSVPESVEQMKLFCEHVAPLL